MSSSAVSNNIVPDVSFGTYIYVYICVNICT